MKKLAYATVFLSLLLFNHTKLFSAESSTFECVKSIVTCVADKEGCSGIFTECPEAVKKDPSGVVSVGLLATLGTIHYKKVSRKRQKKQQEYSDWENRNVFERTWDSVTGAKPIERPVETPLDYLEPETITQTITETGNDIVSGIKRLLTFS